MGFEMQDFGSWVQGLGCWVQIWRCQLFGDPVAMAWGHKVLGFQVWGGSCQFLGADFGLPAAQISGCPNFGVPSAAFQGPRCQILGCLVQLWGHRSTVCCTAQPRSCCAAVPPPLTPFPPPPPISTPPPPPGRRPLGSSTLSASWQPCWASASSPPSWASPKLCPSCSPPPPWPWAAPWPSNCPKLVGRSCSEREGGGWKWG